jgi:hypothetical protein
MQHGQLKAKNAYQSKITSIFQVTTAWQQIPYQLHCNFVQPNLNV